MPVFVITHPYFKAKTRDLKLGWIQDWDDDTKQFLISLVKLRRSKDSLLMRSLLFSRQMETTQTLLQASRSVRDNKSLNLIV